MLFLIIKNYDYYKAIIKIIIKLFQINSVMLNLIQQYCEIFYIGKTINFNQRYNNHTSQQSEQNRNPIRSKEANPFFTK